MHAELIISGTELLLGQLVDTNATYIARKLLDIGLNLYAKTTIGDNEARLTSALQIAISRSDFVIVSGGLGPTVDDVTREAVACATGRPLELRPDLLAQIEARFRRLGRKMADNNRRQAFLPQGAIGISNPVGTAPGFIVEDAQVPPSSPLLRLPALPGWPEKTGPTSTVICLPGVPRELQYLMEHEVLPYLRRRTGGEQIILSKVLRTCSIGESDIDTLIADLEHLSNPTVGLSAHPGQVDIRIAAKASSRAEAESLIAGVEQEIRARLGDYIFGEGAQTLAEVVARMIAARDISLAIVETNTRGLIARQLREGLTAQALLRRVLVLPEEDKQSQVAALRQLAGEEGGTAPPEAAAVARGLRQAAEADLGLAVLGTPGADASPYEPGGGETQAALAWSEGAMAQRFPYGGSDELTQTWVTIRVLDMIRRHLLNTTAGRDP
jgi:nicotinamide-nucleotide amidase